MIWNLEKPWDQVDLFMEIGLMGAKYEVGIDFDFTVGDEGDDLLAALEQLHASMTAVPAERWLHLDAGTGEKIDEALEVGWAAITKAKGGEI